MQSIKWTDKTTWINETGSYWNNSYLQGQEHLKTVFKQQGSGGSDDYDEFIWWWADYQKLCEGFGKGNHKKKCDNNDKKGANFGGGNIHFFPELASDE